MKIEQADIGLKVGQLLFKKDDKSKRIIYLGKRKINPCDEDKFDCYWASYNDELVWLQPHIVKKMFIAA